MDGIDLTQWSSRTELLIGKDKFNALKDAHVLIVGLGGVGAYAAELVCRSGVGNMTIVDGDKVDVSNMNRQLPALVSTINKCKAEVVAERLRDINPKINLNVINCFIKDSDMENLIKQGFDYVIDAIDTLSPKVNLIYQCIKNGIPVVSSMGAGGKFDPSLVKVVDISKSYNCTLARKIRKYLYRMGIRNGCKVVFSPEEVVKESVLLVEQQNKKSTVGTISYMPPIFGCHCASVVIRHLLCDNVQTDLQGQKTNMVNLPEIIDIDAEEETGSLET
jgi:tRNA A37 threonylcarbamoyladenosine dehydratase